jgi:hypothetical protein
MSMIGNYRRVTPIELDALQRDSMQVPAFLFGQGSGRVAPFTFC